MMPVSRPRKPKARRNTPAKHPWAEIEALYVQGEDIQKPGPDGKAEPIHEWPSQSHLAERYNLRLDSISRRLALKDKDGETAHDRKEAFKKALACQVDAKLAEELAGMEVNFRMATMKIAQAGLIQAGKMLTRPVGSEALTRLMTAAKRAQEMGLVALDRPANGPSGENQGTDDWTIMRQIRQGARPVPKIIEGEVLTLRGGK